MKFTHSIVATGFKRSQQRMQPICRWHKTAAPGDVEFIT
jgi:hypothetical protein